MTVSWISAESLMTLHRAVQLIEVLPREEYAWGHLPGARSLPLKELDADAVTAAGIDPKEPVVVYCNDFL